MTSIQRLSGKRRFLSVITFTVPLIALFLAGCATMPAQFTGQADNSTVSLDELTSAISSYRVVFLGEGHSSMADHMLQLEIIKRLEESGASPAVAMEIFPAEAQTVLDAWINGTITDFKELNGICIGNLGLSCSPYKDLLIYMRMKKIPVAGINAPERLVRAVLRKGPSAISRGARESMDYTPCSDDPAYAKAIGLDAKRDKRLCDAERLRDMAMARNIARYLMEGDGRILVVVAGAAHATREAVPRFLQDYISVSLVVLLPESFGGFAKHTLDIHSADYTWQ